MTLGNELTPAPSRTAARIDRTPADAAVRHPAPPRPTVRWSRRRGVMGVFAALAAVGFLGAYMVEPTGAALAEAGADAQQSTTLYSSAQAGAQSIAVDAETIAADLNRGGYQVYVKPKPVVVVSTKPSSGWAPPAVTPNPGSAQAIAHEMVLARGWSEEDFNCLVALWNKESGWRVNAHNKSSGAYGIPQALPGTKMASAGADWETNAATQITWGLGYIGGRYGTPCGAWGHSQARGWY